MFSGYKTYIFAGLAVVTAAAHYLVGDQSLNSALSDGLAALLALGGMSLRGAVDGVHKAVTGA